MAVAGMSIGMTTTAMAATQSYELYCDSSSTYVNTSNYFTVAGDIQSTATALIEDTSAITNIAGETLTLTSALKFNSGGSVAFSTTASDSTVTIWWAAKQSESKTCTLKFDGETLSDTASGATFTTTTISNVEAGSHTIVRASSESNVYYVRVDENFSDTAADYTVTGISNLSSGDTFTFGTATATVGDGGAWTATLTLDSAPTETDTFAVSKDGYTVEPDSVTLTGSGTTYTVSDTLTFTELALTAIPAGTYDADNINAGLPYFDLSGITSGSGSNGRGSIKILLSEDATVTINGNCGSSNTARYVTLSFGDVNEDIYGGTAAADYTSTVAAGELEIGMASTNTTFKTSSITIEYGASVTKYTWAVDTSALTIDIDTTKIGFANDTTTSNSNTLTYSGSDYTIVDGKETVTGTLDEETNVITVAVDDDFFEEVTVGEGVITDKATLTMSEELSKLTSETVVGDGYFTFLTDITVEESGLTIDGLGSYTHRIKTTGKTTLSSGVPTNRAIKFETSGPATVQIVARSGGSSDRDYAVYASDGTIIKQVTCEYNEGYVDSVELISLPSADTYYIACPSAACNFYSVNVVVGSIDTTSNAYGSSFFDIADGYIIANVADDDTTSYDTIVVTANGTSITDTVVYAAALIDGHLITASDLGADYIYVVKGNDAVTNDNTDALKAFTVTFTNSSNE